MTNEDYRQELNLIKWLALNNDFQLFLTMRDIRPAKDYKSFRSTHSNEMGYKCRLDSAKGLLNIFRQAYKIRSRRKGNFEFYYLLIHEAGVGREHFLKENCAHLHIAIGFKPSSRFYSRPDAHMGEFLAKVSGGIGPDSGKKWEGAFSWCDFCSSLSNQNEKFVIQNQEAVAQYLAKAETGSLNGSCFSKQPDWSKNLPNIPRDEDLVLEPLGVM